MELLIQQKIHDIAMKKLNTELEKRMKKVDEAIKTYKNPYTLGVDFAKEYSSTFYNSVPTVEKLIFNNPATIVKWTDGTKTVVKCHNDEFNEEVGFAMAVLRKLYGGRSGYQKIVKDAFRQEIKEEKHKNEYFCYSPNGTTICFSQDKPE